MFADVCHYVALKDSVRLRKGIWSLLLSVVLGQSSIRAGEYSAEYILSPPSSPLPYWALQMQDGTLQMCRHSMSSTFG